MIAAESMYPCNSKIQFSHDTQCIYKTKSFLRTAFFLGNDCEIFSYGYRTWDIYKIHLSKKMTE